ncbi:hypothetical protein AB0P12_20715 [Streptomyces subrutilus]|uniref:hypothetical protein n=1 Tax=Streptomyces subrutilus TaxID=36818 RepID=UPI0034432EA8
MTTTSEWGGTRAALQRAEDQAAAETVPAPSPALVTPAAVPEPGTPEHVEALAAAEAAQAARDVEAIEARVIGGDETVTAYDVEEAHGLARFARLRREAAARKAEAQRQQQAEEHRHTALAEARRLMAAAPKSDVDARLAAAQQAVTELREAIHAYNVGARAAFDALARTPEAPAAPYDPITGPPAAGLAYGYAMGHPALWLDGVNVLALDANGIVKRVLDEN